MGRYEPDELEGLLWCDKQKTITEHKLITPIYYRCKECNNLKRVTTIAEELEKETIDNRKKLAAALEVPRAPECKTLPTVQEIEDAELGRSDEEGTV